MSRMYGIALAGTGAADIYAPTPDFAAAADAGQDGQDGELGRAWAFVRGSAERYLELGPMIADLRHRAAVAGAEARQAGDARTHALAVQTIERLSGLYDVWERLADLARRTIEWSGGSALGAIPWVALGIGGAAALVAAAGTMAYVLARYSAESRIVGMLEARTLTTDEAARLLAETEGGIGISPLGGTTALVLAGVLAWLVWRGGASR